MVGGVDAAVFAAAAWFVLGTPWPRAPDHPSLIAHALLDLWFLPVLRSAIVRQARWRRSVQRRRAQAGTGTRCAKGSSSASICVGSAHSRRIVTTVTRLRKAGGMRT